MFTHRSWLMRCLGIGLIVFLLSACSSSSDSADTQLSRIQLFPINASIANGTQARLTAIGIFKDGSKRDISSEVEWTSSNTTVLSINVTQYAKATARQQGTAEVTATLDDIGSSTGITVTAAQLSRLEISPPLIQFASGTSAEVAVTGIFSDGSKQDMTAEVEWLMSDSQVSFTAADRLTSSNVNSSTLTATHPAFTGISATAQVTVTDAVLQTLTIRSPQTTLPAGLSAPLELVGLYSDGAQQLLTEQASWSVDQSQLAQIDQHGKLAGKAVGSVTVSASLSGQSADYVIDILQAEVTQLQITTDNARPAAGYATELHLIATFSDGARQEVSRTAIWNSNDESIFVVSNNPDDSGKAVALAAGDATVTARYGGHTATFDLTASDALLESLSISIDDNDIPVGLYSQAYLTGIYSDGSKKNLTAEAVWSSSDTSLLAVENGSDISGRLYAIAANPGGTPLNVTASVAGLSAQLPVDTSSAVLTSLSISTDSDTLPKGGRTGLRVLGLYSDNQVKDVTPQVLLEASNNNVRLQDFTELVAIQVGTATLTARLNTITSTAYEITVSAAQLLSIEIDPGSIALPLGFSRGLQAFGVYTDGGVVDISRQVSWSIADNSMAQVSFDADLNAVLQPLTTGTTTLTAQLGAITADNINVTVSQAVLQGLRIDATISQLPAGLSTQLRAWGLYSDGSMLDHSDQVSWQSLTPAVALVSNQASNAGELTALASGSAELSASFQQFTQSITLHISDAVLTDLLIAPGSINLAAGLSESLQAIGVYSDGSNQDLSAQVLWSSSATTVASVSNSLSTPGLLRGLAAGDTTIQASYAGLQDSISVSISDPVLDALSLSPASLSLPLGTSQQARLTAIYTDGSKQDVTTAAQWSSSDSTVLQVSNLAGQQGKLSALSEGSSEISASFGGLTVNASATVSAAVLEQIVVSGDTHTLANNAALQLSATAVYTDGTQQNITDAANWASSDSAVASVMDGVVSSHAAGSTHITANFNGHSGVFELTVSDAVLTGISLSPASATILPGSQRALSAIAQFDDGSSLDVTEFAVWTTDNAGAVSVDNRVSSKGKVSGVANGSANITAAFGGYTDSAAIVVSDTALTGLRIVSSSFDSSLAPVQLYAGFEDKLTVLGDFGDGSSQDLSAVVNWQSSDTSLATISNNLGEDAGVLKTLAAGDVVISASMFNESVPLNLSISDDGAAPVDLIVKAVPNVRNDASASGGPVDSDAPQIVVEALPADTSQTVTDGTQIWFEIIDGNASFHDTESLTSGFAETAGGRTAVSVFQISSPRVTLRVSLASMDATIVKEVDIVVTDDLSEVISLQSSGAAPIMENGKLLAGSQYSVTLTNLSSRDFAFQGMQLLVDGNVVDILNKLQLSDGDLLAGEVFRLVFKTDEDYLNPSSIAVNFAMSDTSSSIAFNVATPLPLN